MKFMKYILVLLAGIGIGIGSAKELLRQNEKKVKRYHKFFRLYEAWLMLKQNGKSLEKYFEQKELKKIVIYGYGSVGRILVKELEQSDIDIIGIMDKKKTVKTDGIPRYDVQDQIPAVDAIVVTPLEDKEKIGNTLREIYNGRILYIEDIIYECI